MESANIQEEAWAKILPILKRGNAAEVKRVNGEIQIVEIQRKIKHRMTITTG